MSHRIVWLLGVFLLAAAVAGMAVAQTTGKIRGKVLDKETGEALVGANVIIETTSMGAVVGVDGEFIIMNVPPQTYALKATYVGYRPLTVRNIRVTVGLTTEADFMLESEAVQGPAIEIIAQAPLVNKNATNYVAVATADQIAKLPVRNVQNVFALSAGVVTQGGNYYVRGGRSEETAYYLDGVLINNPINGALNANIISNAIEEIQTQVGGMTAQYGGAMSGIVNTTTKTGGPKYNASIEMITDNFGLDDNKQILGAYSYGQSEYTATLGGPIIPENENYRFFFAGQRVFNRSNASFMDGVSFPDIDSTAITGADFVVNDRTVDGGVSTGAPGSTGNRGYLTNLLNSTDYGGGRNLGGAARDSWGLQGNLFADLGDVNLKAGGSYNSTSSIGTYGRGINWIAVTADDQIQAGQTSPQARTTLSLRGTRTESWDASAYLKATWIVDPTTFATIQANYYAFETWTGDQFLGENQEEYGNPNNPYNGVLVGPSRNPANFSVYSFGGSWPGLVPLNFTKQYRGNWGGRFDLTKQFSRAWEFIAGGEYNRYTIRTYANGARDLYLLRQQDPAASDWRIYTQAGVSMYGYDIYGNEFDGGMFTDNTGATVDQSKDGPRHPVNAGAYIQNKFEFSDLVINFGLRYDIFDPGTDEYKDLTRIALDDLQGTFVVADSSLQKAEVSDQLSPRLGFSFPVSDRTVFHATYGKYLQQGRLGDYYDTRLAAGYFFRGGFARQFPTPNLKPERTTEYEVGFRQQIGDVASFDLSFYYRDIKDLHVIRVVFPQTGSETSAWFANVNGDYGTSKGLTLSFQLRRTARIALFGNYTLSASTATGSSAGSHFDIAWQDNSYNGTPYFPVIPSYTDFDRTHVGNINIDYRWDKDDGGPILERLGFNVLFTFTSGVRWTFSQTDGAFNFSSVNAPIAFENLNASTGPWTFQIDFKVDKTFTLFENLDANIYLWFTNLLNTRNVTNGVYQGTGQPDNDGYLSTSGGQVWAANNGESAVDLYKYLEDNLGFYGPPRQVRLGLRLNF